MKGLVKMSAEIQVIKLYRELLQTNQKNKTKDSENIFFATDYFDALTVEAKEVTDSFASIMNLKTEDSSDPVAGSAQSYTLYFSSGMGARYEKLAEDKRRMSPFEYNKGDLNFLSLIQIHIAPEIFRRMTYGNEELWNSDKIILEPFLDDLYGIIAEYQADEFVYRVYQVLSTGDFAVAIKSRYPETSFHISTRIRSRVAGIEENDSLDQKYFAIYKTYTLLTFDRSLRNIRDNTNKAGEFVIRGCYSCKYWSEQSQSDEMRTKFTECKDIQGLNGRYDFKMHLSETEFCTLYPFLLQQKGLSLPNNTEEVTKMSEKVRYLVYLIEHDYMSYINERYLLKKDQSDSGTGMKCVSNSVFLRHERLECKELKQSNDEYLERLLLKYQQVKDSASDFGDVHKNLEQYLILLKEQILSCRVINQFADTRIYAKEIAQQLETVLDSFELYREIYNSGGDNFSLQANLVEYMREAVHALDSYAAHVRSNNLQTLQTPNYNLESNMSMEKIMIGYSGFLKSFVECYQDVLGTATNGMKRSYLPIVIPDLHNTDIRVEVLFEEGHSDDWKIERQIRKTKKKETYLLVVDSPTLAELGDVPIFMSLLFHELAHQLRYEDRCTRNKAILKHLVLGSVEQVAGNMAFEISKNLNANTIEMGSSLHKMFQTGFAEEIETAITNQMEQENIFDAPLNYFADKAIKMIQNFFDSLNYQYNLKKTVEQFVGYLGKYCDLSAAPQRKYLVELGKYIEYEQKNENVEQSDGAEEVYDTILKYGWLVSCLAVFNIVKDSDAEFLHTFAWVFDEDQINQWIENRNVKHFETLYSVKNALPAITEQVNQIWNNYQIFFLCISKKKNNLCEWNFKYLERIIKEKVYPAICKLWELQMMKYEKPLLPPLQENKTIIASVQHRQWALLGRTLGIDCEMDGNYKRFSTMMRKGNHFQIDSEQLERRVDIYRETTADMSMYIFMHISLFAYLNLVTQMIQDDSLFNMENNFIRIMNIAYIMEGNKEDSDPHVICESSYNSLFEDLKAYCIEHLNNTISNQIQDLLAKCRWGSSNNDIEENLNMAIDLLHGQTEKPETDKNSQKILRHIAKLCRLISEILTYKGTYVLSLLKEDNAILDDHQNGAKKLRTIRNNVVNKNVPAIRQMLDLGERNAWYLQKFHYKTGEVRDEELNETSIKFLLRQYYSQKLTLAGIDGEEVTDES